MTPQNRIEYNKRSLSFQEKYLAIAKKIKPLNGKRITSNQIKDLGINVETALKYGLVKRIKLGLKRAYYIVNIQLDYEEKLREMLTYSCIQDASNKLIHLKSKNNFMNKEDKVQSKYFLVAELLLPFNGQKISVKEMKDLQVSPVTMVKYGLIKKVKQGTKHQFIIDVQSDYKERIREKSNRVYKRHPNTHNYPFCV